MVENNCLWYLNLILKANKQADSVHFEWHRGLLIWWDVLGVFPEGCSGFSQILATQQAGASAGQCQTSISCSLIGKHHHIKQ